MWVKNIVNICKIDSSTVLWSTGVKVSHHLPNSKGFMDMTSHEKKAKMMANFKV